MKKKLLILILVVFSAFKVFAIKLNTFTDLVNPLMFELDGEYIYISDQNSIFVYDRNDFKLIKKLLSKGDGPQEINSIAKIIIDNKIISIFSDNKVFQFSMGFDFLREIKLSMATEIWKIVPIGRNFVFPHYEEINSKLYELYSLVDENNIKKNDLTEVPLDMSAETKYLISPYTSIASWKSRVYVAQPQKGFFIEVFDNQGERLYTIDKKIDKVQAGEKHRRREQEKYMMALGKIKYNRLESKGLFKKPLPNLLPDIKDIRVVDDRIYIQTYDILGENDKYIILDLTGVFLNTKWLPKAYVKKFTFYKNCFYYFCENENGEGWELHMLKLDN